MDPRDKTYSIVVFPFLKTSKPVRLGSFDFRSTDDVDGLPEEQAASVEEIAGMLFAMGNQRIERASYAITDRIDLESWSLPQKLEAIGDIEAAVAYLYASPRHEFNDLFFTPENASIVVLTPNRVADSLVRLRVNVINVVDEEELGSDSMGFVDGYDGVLGLRHYFWVAPGSRLYGTTPHPLLNISQDLALDVERGNARVDYRLLFELLGERGRYDDLGDRLFSAVRWFNRANSKHRDQAESLICLAVAFETLLLLPQETKRDRFVDSIALLLGRVPRLDDWAAQFYQARSRAVHEGSVGTIAFLPGSNSNKQTEGTKYQSLLAYGREVFQLCLGTILTGASLSAHADLKAKFVPNSERYVTLCKILNDDSLAVTTRLERLNSLAREIDRYQYVPDSGRATPAMLGACGAAARVVLESGAEVVEELRGALRTMASTSPTGDHFERLDALRVLVDQLDVVSDPEREIRGMITLVKTTWGYVYRQYYSIKP